jgi:hypothetical protein
MSGRLWVNEGAEIGDFNRLRSYGITHLYYSARSHTKAHIDQARREHFQVGVYANPQWGDAGGFADAKAHRLWLSRRVTALDGDGKQMEVQLNLEKLAALQAGVDPNQYTIDWFYWWRRVRPDRWTSWTMEGFQGGALYPAMRHGSLAGTFLSPQAYDESMRQWDSHGVVKDLVSWGVDFARILPFYAAPEVMRRGATGFFYMEHLLP